MTTKIDITMSDSDNRDPIAAAVEEVLYSAIDDDELDDTLASMVGDDFTAGRPEFKDGGLEFNITDGVAVRRFRIELKEIIQ